MNRKEIIRFLLGEVAKLPNRQECREKEITESQLEVIAAKVIDFAPIEQFISKNCYVGLTASEIPFNAWFELISYFILNTQRDEAGVIYYSDDIIWNTADEATKEKLIEIKELIGYHKEIAAMPIADFLAYAKSDKPNF